MIHRVEHLIQLLHPVQVISCIFNDTNCIHIFKLLEMISNACNEATIIRALGDIARGTLTTTIGNISLASGNIQTQTGVVSGKVG